MLVWQNFTNTKNPSTILGNTFSKAQMLIWHPFYKAQMLFWHPFYKAQNAILANFSKIFLKAQYYLATIYKNFTNTQKPKCYPWQYFIKSPNTSLAKFYKY